MSASQAGGHQLLPPMLKSVLSPLMTRPNAKHIHHCSSPSLISVFFHLQTGECCQINVPKCSTTGHHYSTKMMPNAQRNTKEDTMIRSSSCNEASRKRAHYWSIHFHLFAAFLFMVAFAPSLLCSTQLSHQTCALSDQLSKTLAKFKAHESKFLYLLLLLV